LTIVPAVDPEITIGGKHPGWLDQFRHANEARVSEAHGQILIFANQASEIRPVVIRQERNFQLSTFNGFKHEVGRQAVVLQQEDGFRDYCIAREQWLKYLLELPLCPGMVLV
jgi:hypothetical protein